jgi:hypothetical protein
MVPNECDIVAKYITFRMIKKIRKQFKNEKSTIKDTDYFSGEALM